MLKLREKGRTGRAANWKDAEHALKMKNPQPHCLLTAEEVGMASGPPVPQRISFSLGSLFFRFPNVVHSTEVGHFYFSIIFRYLLLRLLWYRKFAIIRLGAIVIDKEMFSL